jgi:hypothetical protein
MHTALGEPCLRYPRIRTSFCLRQQLIKVNCSDFCIFKHVALLYVMLDI